MLGIVPLNRICVTPRASLGFHQAYYDKSLTFGVKVTSYAGTADLMSYYPETVKSWIARQGGLTQRHEEGQERARSCGPSSTPAPPNSDPFERGLGRPPRGPTPASLSAGSAP